jgi:hypothetical protein
VIKYNLKDEEHLLPDPNKIDQESFFDVQFPLKELRWRLIPKSHEHGLFHDLALAISGERSGRDSTLYATCISIKGSTA